MADLIAIGYDDDTSAVEAMDEVERLRRDLGIDADVVAAIIRSKDGRLRTVTNQHVGGRFVAGVFWGLLFGFLFFVPFLGVRVGAGMVALMGTIAKSGIDQQFQDQVRDMLKPGTSALFMIVEEVSPDRATDALSRFGGSVLKTSLSADVTKQITDELRGSDAAA
jgi:uncharacterized membrane protein